MKTKEATKKIVVAALLAAIACIATMIIKIPSPLKGYINLGDCIVLLIGWMLNPAYALLSAGIGSALADVFSGYAVYAPITFAIKGLMAVVACCGFKMLNKKIKDLPSRIICGVAAECLMIGGYFIFEGFMYGFGASLVNIPPNVVQGVAGVILGTLLIKALNKTKFKI